MKKMCYGSVTEHWPSVSDVLGSISARQKEMKEKIQMKKDRREKEREGGKGEEKRINSIKRDYQLSVVVHVASTNT